MATIAQILPEFFPGNEWTIDGDDYATLRWFGPDPKPDEATIRANSDATDLIVADKVRREEQQRALNDAPDYLLTGFEIIIAALVDIRKVILLRHSTAASQFDQDVINKVVAMRNKIAAIRAS